MQVVEAKMYVVQNILAARFLFASHGEMGTGNIKRTILFQLKAKAFASSHELRIIELQSKLTENM
jgi:hypothetical protein